MQNYKNLFKIKNIYYLTTIWWSRDEENNVNESQMALLETKFNYFIYTFIFYDFFSQFMTNFNIFIRQIIYCIF